MIGRLVHKADFERLLATRSFLRSAHFALHHVASGDLSCQRVQPTPESEKLSTVLEHNLPSLVDKSCADLWIGLVVPKRHARRAVTRSLLKRQIRCAFDRHAGALAGGHWLLRVRAVFPTGQFVSASSAALATVARCELDRLLGQASAV